MKFICGQLISYKKLYNVKQFIADESILKIKLNKNICLNISSY